MADLVRAEAATADTHLWQLEIDGKNDINSILIRHYMKTLIAYFQGQVDELNRLCGIDATDWEDVYHSSTDDELEEMGRFEEELQNSLPTSFNLYAL